MKRFNIAILTFLLHVSLLAQVTIGNSEKPVDGALLQLSNLTSYGVGEANANKGLGLPRVQLIDNKELYPMFKDSDSEYNTDEKRKKQKEAHIGLLVYSPELFGDNFCHGLYIWDGNEWIPLQKTEEKQQAFTDGEGNSYRYVRYGNLYWTTDNIRTITESGEGVNLIADIVKYDYARGINSSNTLAVNKGISSQGTDMFTFRKRDELSNFGNHAYIINNTKVEVTFDELVSKFGILYTYPQAQKACPTGWRLPTNEEYEDLYKQIQEITGLPVSTAGNAMKNDKSIYSYIDSPSTQLPWNGPDPCEELMKNTGFHALASGVGYQWPSPASLSSHYGRSTFFWYEQGNNYNLNGTYRRYALKHNSSRLERTEPNGSSLVDTHLSQGNSVRCVKEVN